MNENANEIENSENVKSKSGGLQLSDIWKGIMKFWWVSVLLAGILCGGLFAKSYFNFSPQYTVYATFTVNTQSYSLDDDMGLPSYSFYYDNATASQLADTFPYILSSNILNEAICNDLKIDYVPVSLSASAVESTNMFTLTAVGSDAQTTYDVLVSAMNNYPAAAKYLVGNVKLTIITQPELPLEPTNKFTYTTALKGFAAGFLLGAAWILLYAFLRKTIKTKNDIHNILKQNVVGTLPEVSFKKYKKEKIDTSILITNEKIGRGFLESVRVYRNTFVNILNKDEKVVLITSTAPGEGKTTACVNLSLSLVSTGKSVLVVDCDLRNPSVQEVLNFDFDNIEYYETNDDYSIATLADYDVDYLRFNRKAGKYWKVIEVDYLRNLFNSLREKYDYILVDTPPCGLVSDTAIIADACDAAVYVTLQDAVRVTKIQENINTILHTNARVLGVVLNGAQSGLTGYGENYGYGYANYGHYKNYSIYGYGYGYGYGYYGYGYGEKKSDKKKDKSESEIKEKEKSKISKNDSKD